MVARRVRPTVPEPAAIPISKRKELYVLAIFLWSLFLSGTFFAIGWVGNSINQNAAAMSPQSPPPASPPTAPPALLPLAVSNEKEWLIATSGICYDLTLAFAGGDVGPEAPGDTAAGFIAGIAFKYQPQTAVRFTDYPYHEANVINGSSETTALTSAMWSFKNIALLESNCSDVVGHSCSFGTIIFKVETHGVCTTSGSPCVEYTGNVSVATNSVEGLPLALRSFACQLFVDGASMSPAPPTPPVSPFVLWRANAMCGGRSITYKDESTATTEGACAQACQKAEQCTFFQVYRKPGACSNFCQLIIQGGECSDENLFANDGVKVYIFFGLGLGDSCSEDNDCQGSMQCRASMDPAASSEDKRCVIALECPGDHFVQFHLSPIFAATEDDNDGTISPYIDQQQCPASHGRQLSGLPAWSLRGLGGWLRPGLNLFAGSPRRQVLPSNFVGFFRYKAPAGSYAPGAAVAVGAGGAVWAGMQADILGNLAGLAQNFMVGILNFVWGFSKGPISRVVWIRVRPVVLPSMQAVATTSSVAGLFLVASVVAPATSIWRRLRFAGMGGVMFMVPMCTEVAKWADGKVAAIGRRLQAEPPTCPAVQAASCSIDTCPAEQEDATCDSDYHLSGPVTCPWDAALSFALDTTMRCSNLVFPNHWVRPIDTSGGHNVCLDSENRCLTVKDGKCDWQADDCVNNTQCINKYSPASPRYDTCGDATPCRYAYMRVNQRSSDTCPPGLTIWTSNECSLAAKQLGATNTSPAVTNGMCFPNGKGNEPAICAKQPLWKKLGNNETCPTGMEIFTVAACNKAIEDLNLIPELDPSKQAVAGFKGIGWYASDKTVPTKCSVRDFGPDQMGHFNTAVTGKARDDLAPVCSGRFVKKGYGELCDPEDQIDDLMVCLSALINSGLPYDSSSGSPMWVATSPSLPSGCSVRGWDKQDPLGHFNKSPIGQGHPDLAPICLAKSSIFCNSLCKQTFP